MKALKWIGIVLLVIVVIYAVMCIAQPNKPITRSITINAPDSLVYKYIIDFNEWEKWSAWDKNDPNMKNTKKYEGNPGMIGHAYSWKSESQGNGSQKIVELKPYSFVKTELRFEPNTEDAFYSDFKLATKDNQTTVDWTVNMEMPFFMRGFNFFFKSMMIEQFDSGLKSLKELVETTPVLMPPPPMDSTAVDTIKKDSL